MELALAAAGGKAAATLYAFSPDTATKSRCEGTCARIWPPLLTSAPAVAGAGLKGTLGAIQRRDGSFQVTFAGHPLYLFGPALDTTTSGDGVVAFGGTWNLLNASGTVG
jgi:predicted lipoprotein with Yx(FWY)xxD motif